jgi:thiol-disulfide isomerase/thioredoxin
MSLQERLDAFKADFEGNKAPPEVVALFHRTTADLVATGQATRALKAGDRAPAFALADQNGNMRTLSEMLAQGPLVITFYRGVWCPYCNLDLEALQAAAAKIRDAGANLVAISPQTQPTAARHARTTSSLSRCSATPAMKWRTSSAYGFVCPTILQLCTSSSGSIFISSMAMEA